MNGSGLFGPVKPSVDEIRAFGKHWCGPEIYNLREKTLVAEYPKSEGSDGQSVKVFCTAMSARFYDLEVAAEPDSVGEPQPAFRVSTGSGESVMAAMIAKAIAEGMLSFEVINQGTGSSNVP